MEGNLKDKLRVGMTYEELTEILGEPTHIKNGSSLLAGSGKVIASENTRAYLQGTLFCCWKRPEAEYYLTITKGKLSKIHSINPPIPPESRNK